MDDYKKYYYQRIGNEKVSIQKEPAALPAFKGSLSIIQFCI